MKEWFEKDKLKKVPQMIIAVLIMGVCVSVLKLTAFGPDPCSTMNYGVSGLLGLSFGFYQMCLNIVVFIIIFFIDRQQLGLGSFGNMILVGYSADFTSWVLEDILHIASIESFIIRFLVMICTLVVFVFAAAVYMNSGLGTAPYDALSFLLHKKLFADKGKKLPFKAVRIAYDALAALIGFVTGGGVGIVTILMIPTLGPCVDYVGKKMRRAD